MGKHGEKMKRAKSSLKQTNAGDNSPRAYDKDTAVFISMSQELKDEGNRLFQKRDYEGAILKYEKAIKLLPRNHIDVSYLRSNMAACYMQLGISEYPRAIHECNLALEVTPKYSKALLKRARCYEALNRLDLAIRDVGTVLKMEPNNLMAIEIDERVKKMIERQDPRNEIPINLVSVPEYFEPPRSPETKVAKEKARKRQSNNAEPKKVDCKTEEIKDQKCGYEKNVDSKSEEIRDQQGGHEKEPERKTEEWEADVDVVVRNAEDKLVVEEEKICDGTEEESRRTVKLVYGEDIRWAQIPLNCNFFKLREIISERFPTSKAVFVKYRDQEGDLVTVTTTEELRLAEASAEHGSVKLYVIEVNPDQDPFFERVRKANPDSKNITENGHVGKRKEECSESACISDWIIQFAQFFKNYVGFDIDAYLDLHEVGMKLYSDAMEETVTSEEAQDIFCTAAEKFQEMAALALFNWGNVHMSMARKKVYFTEDSSRESVLTQVKCAYEWAQNEYMKAGQRYEEALRIKPNFYEAVLAFGQQQFEQAKLSWYYAIGTDADLESWPSAEALQLYNNAEECIEKGIQMWEAAEEQRVKELSQQNKTETLLKKMKLDKLLKRISEDEAAEQAANFRSQIHVLWGTILYERSLMEFKLGLPMWRECLEVAVDKFEIAGSSPTDVAVMIKNHCSNDTASEGLGFKIDEIVQAWNEMYEAKSWKSSIHSFRLEPLLRRRVSKLYYALEHA